MPSDPTFGMVQRVSSLVGAKSTANNPVRINTDDNEMQEAIEELYQSMKSADKDGSIEQEVEMNDYVQEFKGAAIQQAF